MVIRDRESNMRTIAETLGIEEKTLRTMNAQDAQLLIFALLCERVRMLGAAVEELNQRLSPQGATDFAGNRTENLIRK